MENALYEQARHSNASCIFISFISEPSVTESDIRTKKNGNNKFNCFNAELY